MTYPWLVYDIWSRTGGYARPSFTAPLLTADRGPVVTSRAGCRRRFALLSSLNRGDEVARGGVEPPTFRFSVGRSYQLSYLAVYTPSEKVPAGCASVVYPWMGGE